MLVVPRIALKWLRDNVREPLALAELAVREPPGTPVDHVSHDMSHELAGFSPSRRAWRNRDWR